MDGLTFWSTMGQVSATFAGLVFAGLSFYIKGIHSAINEVEPQLKRRCKSEKLMHTAVLANLSLFIMPLILSFYMISEKRYPDYQYFIYLLLLFFLIIIISNFIIYKFKYVKKDLDYIKDKGPKLLKRRVIFGKYFVSFIGFILCFFAISYSWLELSWSYAAIKVASLSSILMGIIIGVYDMHVFNSKNICFEMDPSSFNHYNGLKKDIGSKINFAKIEHEKLSILKLNRNNLTEIGVKKGFKKEEIDDFFDTYLIGIDEKFSSIQDRKKEYFNNDSPAWTLENLRARPFIKELFDDTEMLHIEMMEQLERFNKLIQ